MAFLIEGDSLVECTDTSSDKKVIERIIIKIREISEAVKSLRFMQEYQKQISIIYFINRISINIHSDLIIERVFLLLCDVIDENKDGDMTLF